MGFHIFDKGISPKVNIVVRLEFELAYIWSTVKHFSHYVTGTFLAGWGGWSVIYIQCDSFWGGRWNVICHTILIKFPCKNHNLFFFHSRYFWGSSLRSVVDNMLVKILARSSFSHIITYSFGVILLVKAWTLSLPLTYSCKRAITTTAESKRDLKKNAFTFSRWCHCAFTVTFSRNIKKQLL